MADASVKRRFCGGALVYAAHILSFNLCQLLTSQGGIGASQCGQSAWKGSALAEEVSAYWGSGVDGRNWGSSTTDMNSTSKPVICVWPPF